MTEWVGTSVPMGFPVAPEYLDKLRSENMGEHKSSRAVYVTEGVSQIKGPSRLQYVPYQRTVIDYQPVETIDYVPVQRKVIEYEQRTRIEQVPIEETYTDYYAVEHITQYVPQVIPQKKIEYVPVERIQNRVEYYPVQKEVLVYHNQSQQMNRTDQYAHYQQSFQQSYIQSPSHHNQYSYHAPPPPTHNPRMQQTSNFNHRPYAYQAMGRVGLAAPVQEPSRSSQYVSPLDFTRQNISPRVSGVSGYSYSHSKKSKVCCGDHTAQTVQSHKPIQNSKSHISHHGRPHHQTQGRKKPA